MEKTSVIEPIDFDNAEDFLDYLQLRKSHWLPEGAWSSPWIFRGQPDAGWKLIPRAWRPRSEHDSEPVEMRRRFRERFEDDPHSPFKHLFLDRVGQDSDDLFKELFSKIAGGSFTWRDYLKHHDISDNQNIITNLINVWLHTAAEAYAITEFIEEANRLGYPIQDLLELGSWQAVIARHIASSMNKTPYFQIWDGRNHPGVALAQHHGIPTALLDFTRNPQIAAHFAAEGYEKLRREEGLRPERIAVWALHTDVLEPTYLESLNLDAPIRLQKLTYPRSGLSYLHAQDALFVYDRGGDRHFLENGTWPSMEDVLGDSSALYLRKITLLSDQTEDLLRLLWAEGISRASLMPIFDNVTTALKVKWQYQNIRR